MNMITANVENIKESLESIYYLQAEITFTNGDEKTCNIQGYTLSWPGGSAVFKPKKLIIAPHSSLLRKIRITPDQGDLKSMYQHPERIKVEIDKYRSQ